MGPHHYQRSLGIKSMTTRLRVDNNVFILNSRNGPNRKNLQDVADVAVLRD